MKYFAPDPLFVVPFKRYTAGDYRQNDPRNIDDRERVAKIIFDLRELQLQPL